jgi:hypothetical protein
MLVIIQFVMFVYSNFLPVYSQSFKREQNIQANQFLTINRFNFTVIPLL